MKQLWKLLIFTILFDLPIMVFPAQAQDAEKLSEEQKRVFLSTATIEHDTRVGKGVTGIRRLTLSDGTNRHDAAFQAIDEFQQVKKFDDGRTEPNFHDSYKYDIAAYELAKLLGLGDMMPVTVARKWQGKNGALSWWLPVKMDELKRVEKKILPPDVEAWNEQMHRMRVFTQLVYDTDRNLGNVLISEEWHLWMIDFTRAFRPYRYLQNPKDLIRIDHELLDRLRRLSVEEVRTKSIPFLTNPEIEGLMSRRDRIIAIYDKLVASKGEKEVLY